VRGLEIDRAPAPEIPELSLGKRPFVLLEDVRERPGVARVFANPVETIVADHVDDVASALARVRDALKRGFHVAGWLSYEAGFALEPALRELKPGDEPLLWFGVFASPERLTSDAVTALLPSAEGAWLSPPRPRMARREYDAAFARAHEYIRAGDIYQVNLSFRSDVTLLGDPLAAYSQLRASGGGAWSGVVFNGSAWVLSASPELFFRLSAGRIETRPMKGTARRSDDPGEDRAAGLALVADPKERAENLMIVDLLRNDISKIAVTGSVSVPALFSLETYPTVHTLTSTVAGQARDGADAIDVLSALFPCGSITGAPKIRAMQIIDELEHDHRGVYTGAIGWMAPDGDAEFSVAIRTLSVRENGASLGLGSAVTFDSVADQEWEECLLKGRFVANDQPPLCLLETMRFTPEEGVAHLDLHMARLGASARAFLFPFDEELARAFLRSELAHGAAPTVVCLTLDGEGRHALTVRPLPATPSGPVELAIAPLPVDAGDFRLRHKTTRRSFYDRALSESGSFEVMFVDEHGFVTQGSFTNVFVMRDGVLATPPGHRGILPGVLRAALLRDGRAQERELRPEDLASGCFIGNAVRGLIPAQLRAA
jgi:para-aminobenzoate synthetase/4-amino-4-deoxychorismate lyase